MCNVYTQLMSSISI